MVEEAEEIVEEVEAMQEDESKRQMAYALLDPGQLLG